MPKNTSSSDSRSQISHEEFSASDAFSLGAFEEEALSAHDAEESTTTMTTGDKYNEKPQ